MRGFQNGLTFKIWTSSSRDIHIFMLQKGGFLWTKVQGDLIGMVPKTIFYAFL